MPSRPTLKLWQMEKESGIGRKGLRVYLDTDPLIRITKMGKIAFHSLYKSYVCTVYTHRKCTNTDTHRMNLTHFSNMYCHRPSMVDASELQCNCALTIFGHKMGILFNRSGNFEYLPFRQNAFMYSLMLAHLI